MLQKGTAKKVTIFVNEDTQHHHFSSLCDAILTFLLHKGVSGATATRAMAGFGAHHTMHTTKIEVLTEHLPIRIEFIESAEKVDEVMPTLYDMVTDGVIEVQDTQVVKVASKERPSPPKGPHTETRGTARLMRIYMGESDKWQGEPLYEAILKRLRPDGYCWGHGIPGHSRIRSKGPHAQERAASVLARSAGHDFGCGHGGEAGQSY